MPAMIPSLFNLVKGCCVIGAYYVTGIFVPLFLKTLKYAWYEPFTLIKAVRDRRRFRHACGLSPPPCKGEEFMPGVDAWLELQSG